MQDGDPVLQRTGYLGLSSNGSMQSGVVFRVNQFYQIKLVAFKAGIEDSKNDPGIEVYPSSDTMLALLESDNPP